MRKRWVVLMLVLAWSAPASAQLAVADAPVLAAVGSVLAALKQIMMDTRQALADLADWSDVVSRLQAVAQLTTDVEALVEEVATIDEGWAQLSDSGQALCSIDEAIAWKGQALQWQQSAFAVVRQVNRLLGRSLAIHIDLQGIIGGTSGAQSTSALLTVIAGRLAQLQSLTGSFQSASLGKDVIESVIGIQLVCIHQHDFADWGSYSR